MLTGHHRYAASFIAAAALIAGLWLLLFGGPALLNEHRDSSVVLALLVYSGVPAVVAWGGPRLWRFIRPGEFDHE